MASGTSVTFAHTKTRIKETLNPINVLMCPAMKNIAAYTVAKSSSLTHSIGITLLVVVNYRCLSLKDQSLWSFDCAKI